MVGCGPNLNTKGGPDGQPQIAPQVSCGRRGGGAAPSDTFRGRASQGEDYAREMLGSPEHESLVQSERDARDGRDGHRDDRYRRGRFARPDPRSCRQPDREEPVRDREDLAPHVHGPVLPAGTRKDPWARRARYGAMGHQRKGVAAPAVRPAARHHAHPCGVLCDDVQANRRGAAGTRSWFGCCSGAAWRWPRRWRRGQFRRGAARAGASRDGSRISLLQGRRRHRRSDPQ